MEINRFATTVAIRRPVQPEKIQRLLDGETNCWSCIGQPGISEGEHCPHLMADLETILAASHHVIEVPWYGWWPGHNEWPMECQANDNGWFFCDSVIDECAVCGLQCICDGSVCAEHADDPEDRSDDIRYYLQLALAGVAIVAYRRRPGYERAS